MPGRATWVPGAPPGFNSSPGVTQISSPQESAPGIAGPVVVPRPAADLQPPGLRQPPAGQRTLKQGTSIQDPLEYAWDVRHQLPRGYWLTSSGPRHAPSLNGSLDASSPVLGEGGAAQGNTTGDEHGASGPGMPPLPFPPRPGSGGSQQHSSTSSSSPLGGPIDVTPTFPPGGWEPSSGPPLSFFSPELFFGHESFGTDARLGPPDQANGAVPRGSPTDTRLGGRDLWPPGRGVPQNTLLGAEHLHVEYQGGVAHGRGHGRDSPHSGESGRPARPVAGSGLFVGARGRVPTATKGTATLPTGTG